MTVARQNKLYIWLTGIIVLIALSYAGGMVYWSAKPVLLWTDALVYVLVVAITAFMLYARNKEHMREPWRQVLRSRLGMAALVVLLVYVVTGLLDSVHFRLPAKAQDDSQQVHYSADVLSVLDVFLAPVREADEKTYSAPFATHAYARETVEKADGTSQRIYPRLLHGGSHLQNPQEEWLGDIIVTGIVGIVVGLLLWAVLAAWISARLAKRWQLSFTSAVQKVLRADTDVAWQTIFLTLAVLLVLIGMAALLAPKYHIFGTDKVGQDVFYQTIKSIRTGLVIGTLTTLIMLPFAIMLGIAAGYFKGKVDDVIQYLYTTLSSIPDVLLIAAAVLMMQIYMANNPEMFETETHRADLKLLFLCIILGVTSWTGLCRLLRGEAMKLREVDFVQASQALGVSDLKILLRHVQPNVAHIVLISVVLGFSSLVLAEAVLSYIGIGVDPTMHSWGNLINAARLEMAREPIVWWLIVAAFLFMFTLVLAANLFADAVRDAFDPRIRKQ